MVDDDEIMQSRIYPKLPKLPSPKEGLEHLPPSSQSLDPPFNPDFTAVSNFRLREIAEIERELTSQIEHYRAVLKKYKKLLKSCYYSSLCCSFVSVALSSGAIASSLTGFGLVVGAPAAGAAAISSSATALLSFFCRKFERKVSKHSKIVALAVSKHDTINSLVSRSLVSNSISDDEFSLILSEKTKFYQLKESIRSRFSDVDQARDVDRIRQEVRQELTKKISLV